MGYDIPMPLRPHGQAPPEGGVFLLDGFLLLVPGSFRSLALIPLAKSAPLGGLDLTPALNML